MKDVLIDNLGLSVRATNALNNMQIHTLEQLLDTPIDTIRAGRNIGVKTLNEILEFCKSYIQEKENRVFSKEEIEEMSHHYITELDLSVRAEKRLLFIQCDTLEKLLAINKNELIEMKGIGIKTYNEIINKKNLWIARNLCEEKISKNVNIISSDDGISAKEREFYIQLSQLLSPIKHILWRDLREILLERKVMKGYDDFSLQRIDNEYIYSVLLLDEFELPLKLYFNKFAFNGIIRIEELKTKLDEEKLEFNKNIIINSILDKRICYQIVEYLYVDRQKLPQYLKEDNQIKKNRHYEIFIQKLNGESLQQIGNVFGLTRERIRQLLGKMVRNMPYLYEDYYKFPYEYFKLSEKEFCSIFPECGIIGYRYLSIRYKKGKKILTEYSVSTYTSIFKERLEKYLKKEIQNQDEQHLTKRKIICHVFKSNSDYAMSMEEFERKYYEYVEYRNYPRDRFRLNIRTVSNYFRESSHIVFNKANKFRYYEIDHKLIWELIDFNQYRDSVISSELIYRDYIELMEELDIKDGYELFYIIKSSIHTCNNCDFEIKCRRVPIIILGNGNEVEQALRLLQEISPIDFCGYYKAYEERYGVRGTYGNSKITSTLANYYLHGEYSIDVVTIDDDDAIMLKRKLSEKKFWFIDEVERIFKSICVHSSPKALNKAAFKRIGYSLNAGYVYNNVYSSVINYLNKEIFSKDILNLDECDHRLCMLSTFRSALYQKRMNLEYIEVAPRVYMTLSKLKLVYGLTVHDIQELQSWICRYEEKYFNAHSVWKKLQNVGLDKKLKENEWLCTCIFRQQDGVFSQHVAGGIILSKDSREVNLGEISRWLFEKYGKLTVQNLTYKINELFGTRIKVDKIAYKLKTYGLWETIVTDSFDDYIDNIMTSTENANDVDLGDLFQEEFF